MSAPHKHDFVPYLQSISEELRSVRNRVRQLVKHMPTDGHFKEALLRQILRRHLPEDVLIGTGFVVNFSGPSGEIDTLVIDRSMPTLFKEGELLIVTPESVRAIIEVKTRVRGKKGFQGAIQQLAERKAVIERHTRGVKATWAGLFVYEGTRGRDESILEALQFARQQTDSIVDAVAVGDDFFVKHFTAERFKLPAYRWHSFLIPQVAAANFVASLNEHLLAGKPDMGSFAWFTLPEGFEARFSLSSQSGATVEKITRNS